MADAYILGLLIIGLLVLTVSWGSGWIMRLPLSYAILYLGIGIVLGPYGIGLHLNQPNTEFIERFTEFVVIVSLYSSGLKTNRPLKLPYWNSTIRCYGFLAVFVAGYMVEKRGCYPDQRRSQLQFVTQIEKLLEVGAILLLGSLLRVDQTLEFGAPALLIAGSLLFIIRPIGAWVSTAGGHFHPVGQLA